MKLSAQNILIIRSNELLSLTVICPDKVAKEREAFCGWSLSEQLDNLGKEEQKAL